MKEIILKTLYVIWSRILPLLFVLAFFVSVCFNLWKIQNIPLGWSILISVLGLLLAGFGLGKLIKLW